MKGSKREKRKIANCVNPCGSCDHCYDCSDRKAIPSFSSPHESNKVIFNLIAALTVTNFDMD